MTTDSPAWTPARHPLARLLREVASGRHPPQDGEWMRVSPWSPHLQAIISFTGHAVLAVSYDTSDARLQDLGVGGWGGVHSPRVICELAGSCGWIDSLDVLLLALGRGAPAGDQPLVARPDLVRHPRAAHAKRVRQDVQVLGRRQDRPDVVTLSRGVAGLREIGVEVEPDRRGRGNGTELVSMALDCIPEHEVVAATVAPGNAAGVRACLRAGFTPVGSIQLFSNRPEQRM